MATVNKDFKIKQGLVVEGTTGTINNFDILTKKQADQDYIIGLIGGSATSEATPDTVVLRDANADFAAHDITVNKLNIGTIGSIYDDGDLIVSASNDAILEGDDIRLNAVDDVRLTAQGGDVVIGSNTGHIRFVDGPVHIGFPVTAENEVATKEYVDGQISNIDLTFNTDEISEGTTNLYYTDGRARLAINAGTGIDYNSATGYIDANLGTGLGLDGSSQIEIDRTTVDTWYEDNGAVSSHNSNTSEVHGVNGDVVGTSDTQTLTNKTIGNALTFNDGGADTTVAPDGDNLELRATDGQVNVYGGAVNINPSNNIWLTSNSGDIVLSADGAAYYGGTTAADEIATHGYVDNAVSGLAWKQAVNLLYDAAIPVLSGSGASQLIVDGHDPLGDADTGYRLLLTGVTSPGIYVFESTGGSWTLTRSTDADVYSELIGAAVYVMEGTQYGSTSWVQSDHYITDFSGQDWTQFSGQGSVTAGTGITVDGLEVSVNRTTVDAWYDAAGTASDAIDAHDVGTGVHGLSGDIVGTSDSQTLTNKTIDAASNTLSNIANSSLTNSSITVNGYSTDLGSSVTLDTDDVSEGAAQYFTNQRALDATAAAYDAAGTAQGIVDALDTDDIEEGSVNQYFTDGRAKTSAADLLTGATLSNITITGTGAGLTITAENGVAGSTTDDLTEGEDNLYFTDARAQGAVNNTTPNFYAVELDSIAKQVAVLTDAPTAGVQVGHAFAKADYRSAEYLVKVAYGDHTEISKVLLTLDVNDNIAITEYGIVGTNGSASTISAGISGTDVQLLVTTANNDSTVTVMGTLLV